MRADTYLHAAPLVSQPQRIKLPFLTPRTPASAEQHAVPARAVECSATSRRAAEDLVEGQPTRVSLFDEAIAVVRRPGQSTIAYVDRCPHRAAALSEGRLTASGNLQCSYHGWTFDEGGSCVSIPQVRDGAGAGGRACATALPCVDQQGIIWVCSTPGASPPMDTIVGLPELDREGWVSDDFVRDMPVDYTLLVENLVDPDHGLFAHQTPNFDSYAASSDHPMSVQSEPGRTSDKIVGRVDGVLKLTGKDEAAKSKALMGEKGSAQDIKSTLEFEPPCMVRWSRFDQEGKTSFITAFYAIPLGIGRSRLLIRYARSIAPWFKAPRWLFSMFLNGFLDQDTYLVASQQATTVGAELAAAQRMGLSSGPSDATAIGPAPDHSPPAGATGLQRRQLYCHRSPTDKLLLAVGQWLDDAVPHMPNRYRGLQGGHLAGAAAAALLLLPREVVLDRWECHTAICPSSRRAHSVLSTVRNTSGIAAAVAAVAVLSQLASGTQGLSSSTPW
ncbi:hypothetical protein WJX73_007161 [Symbiochloris irregularis]|uniref:Rieske domain-containing protein n=1 Tax=Symbiochloris irregularis TaxID=706552 RepID=A0AAW1P521_9CHLO